VRKRRFSILLVPEDNGEVKRLRATSSHLHMALLGLSLLLAAIVFLTVQYVGRVGDAAALARLGRENATMRAQMTDLEDKVSAFQVQMVDLVKREKALRTMTGLPEIDPDIRKVGVGGQGYEELYGPSVFLEDPEAPLSLLMADLDQLLRQAKLEKKSFQDVEIAFRKNRERLEHTPTIWPVDGHLSRGFGYCIDPFTNQHRFHEGIDIVNRVGTPIKATAAGTVVERGWRKGYGWVVVLDHGYGYQSTYGHLDSIELRRGEEVKRGEIIATLGNSGRSTGPHLHYEVRLNGQPVDPLKFILSDVVVD
jgi:murein DD-endopeptidase MepM/ murein hydrolase activator NlpD